MAQWPIDNTTKVPLIYLSLFSLDAMPVHEGQKIIRHWSKNVRDVSVAHDSLHIRIEGGAENGEFLYVGAFTSEQIKYRKGRLRSGDILVELNDEAVVGLTLQDLMNRINKAGKKVNLKVVQPGGGITKDLRDFLGQEFPSSNEVDLDLQDVIRDNLYARTVPCTTRPPRSREEPGIDYIFVSKEKFQEMEKSGDFLESGTYNGHYYGTLKPALHVNCKEELSLTNEDETNPLRDIHNAEVDKEINCNGNVTVHREIEPVLNKEVKEQNSTGKNDDQRDGDDIALKQLEKSQSEEDATENHFSNV